MSEWSKRFAEWFGTSGHTQVSLAELVDATSSQVFYWSRGSEPRDPKMLKSIEKVSKGKVRASLAEPGRNRRR